MDDGEHPYRSHDPRRVRQGRSFRPEGQREEREWPLTQGLKVWPSPERGGTIGCPASKSKFLSRLAPVGLDAAAGVSEVGDFSFGVEVAPPHASRWDRKPRPLRQTTSAAASNLARHTQHIKFETFLRRPGTQTLLTPRQRLASGAMSALLSHVKEHNELTEIFPNQDRPVQTFGTQREAPTNTQRRPKNLGWGFASQGQRVEFPRWLGRRRSAHWSDLANWRLRRRLMVGPCARFVGVRRRQFRAAQRPYPSWSGPSRNAPRIAGFVMTNEPANSPLRTEYDSHEGAKTLQPPGHRSAALHACQRVAGGASPAYNEPAEIFTHT